MDTADTFIRLYAQRIRRPGETAAQARERARLELPTVARLAENEPQRQTLRILRAI